MLSGQTTSGYTCVASAQVSVDGACQYIFDPQNFLLEDSIPDNLKVFVFDKDPSNREIVECPGTYNYSITNERNAIICWGLITLLDDQAPVPVDTITTIDTLECAQIGKILNNPSTISPTLNGQANPYYLGQVNFVENCTSCNCEMNVKFFDQVDFFPCDSLPYFAKITRKWTATDCENNISQVDQFFYLVRPSLDSLQKVPDQDIQSCVAQDVVIKDQYPFWIDVFGDTLYINDLDCNLDVQLIDNLDSQCGGNKNILTRQVQVFDWCTGDTTIVDTIQIRYGDFSGPVFAGKARPLGPTNTLNTLNQAYTRDSIIKLAQEGFLTELSTGPMDCTISFPLGQELITDLFNFSIADCGEVNLSFAFFSLEQEAGLSAWTYSSYNSSESIVGMQVSNIPPGLHAMVVEANDNCANSGKAVVFFIVRDRISPIAKCIDDLTIDFGNNNNDFKYQSLSIDEIDQNSEDNCQMGDRQVRRAVSELSSCLSDFISLGYDTNSDGLINEQDYFDTNSNGLPEEWEEHWTFEEGIWYTPWMDRIDFFCCDVDQSISVQVRFFDQATEPISGAIMPNESQCWFNVFIEDSSEPILTAPDEVSIECSDPIINLIESGSYSMPNDSLQLNSIHQRLGAPFVTNAGCGAYSIEEEFIPNLDNCGFGTITRTITLTKNTGNGSYQKSVQQIIQITEQYDYWMKFPKDIEAFCSEAVIDSGYLEVTEAYCDLLAVTYSDDYFYSPVEEEACFKIFRTYRIINWCEYDGTSAPVIVSRDWDTWNGFTCDENYNVNPEYPDGNNNPGDSDLFVIVRRNFNDELPDTVYYDIDSKPDNAFPDDPSTSTIKEGYWWKVISGSGSPQSESYYLDPIPCSELSPAAEDGQLPNVWGANIYEDVTSDSIQLANQRRAGSYGYWQYTQHILIYDDSYPEIDIIGAPFICGQTNEECLVPTQFILETSDQCVGSNQLELEVFFDENRDNENLIDYSWALQDSLFAVAFPVGEHQLVLWANDNCGNRVRQVFSFSIQDCTAPKPKCKPGLTANLTRQTEDDAVAIIQAEDLIESPTFDCAGQGSVQNENGQLIVTDYSINLSGDNVNRNKNSLVFSCADLRQQDYLVEVHAWDNNDLHDYCETLIMLQDTDQACPLADGMIAGTIFTEDNRFVQNADVALSGRQSMLYLSDEFGNYTFDEIQTNTDYTVSPSLNSGFLNGISTYDILLIQNHILGKETLDSPYKLIAADVNNSKAISTLDLIELRKLILSIDLRFKNNTSWRFVPSTYQFPNPQNPWSTNLPNFINVNNLQDSSVQVDFIGIKIGDVSGNANTASTLGFLNTESRNASDISLTFSDQPLEAGISYQIPIMAKMSDIDGMQFTLGIDPEKAEIMGIKPAALQENHFQYQQERGWVAASWLQSESNEDEIRKEVCFTLTIRPKAQIALSQIIQISDYWIKSEAYQAGEIKNLKLLPKNPEITSSLLLEQNYPNPFHESTLFVFQTREKKQLQIQIIDTNGRLIKNHTGVYPAGENSIRIEGSSLPGPGIYFIKISDGQRESVKRMIFF